MGRNIIGIYGLILALLLPGLIRADVGKIGQARLALSQSGPSQFSGETGSKDFWVRMPAHVYPQTGSSLTLALHTQPTLLSLVAAIEVQVNGETVSTMSLDTINPRQATNSPVRVVASIPPPNLQSGGNRLSLQFLFRKTAEANRDVLKTTTWTFEPSESFFTLAYERQDLFPEMRRFPESLAEEKLLQSDNSGSPLIELFLPARLRDAPLRGCAIAAARLGQLGYIADRDYRITALDKWSPQSGGRSGLIIGCRDELDSLALPSQLSAQIRELRSGQGLLAEFITGQPGQQARWLVASGADEMGLERAVLTLGHSSAMAALPSNPAIIETEPVFEPEAKPVQQKHSSLWTQCQAFLTSAAMRITGAIHLSESKDAPVISQQPVNGKGAGLQCLEHILIRDSSLEQTAFLLPKSASMEQAKLVFDLALYMGSQLPASPVLWPEACTFSRSALPPQTRLEGRTVLMLAPVAEWANAFASPLVLEVPADQIGRVRIQGRLHKISAFEPTLGFVHLLPSPWSKGEQVLAAGGWMDAAPHAIKDLIERAAPAGKLAGNLCAADARGRTAVYDTRHPKTVSFVQVLQKCIPEGLSENETARQLQAAKLHAAHSAGFNRMISCVAGGWLVLLVAMRFLLLWDRECRRRRTLRDEKLLPSPNLEMTHVQ